MPRLPRTSKTTGKGRKDAIGETQGSIPYAPGFKPPTVTAIHNAIGFKQEIPREFSPSKHMSDNFEFFKPIPKPNNIDDWLAQYDEDGQSYQQFLKDCPWLSSRKRKYMSQKFTPSGQTIKQKYPEGKVYIVPIGDFEQEGTEFYSNLIDYTSKFLGLPVVSLPKIKLEYHEGRVYWVDEPRTRVSSTSRTSQRTKKYQLTSRYNLETKRFQVCVDSNLMQLRQMIPNDAICMIGLTMLDLYGEDSDLFVAGMAAGNQRVAIFSLYRYDPCLTFSIEHWFKAEESNPMSSKERQRIILQRSCKLLVHEICHLLGVDHCIYFDCCMNGSGHLAEDFRQPMHLCPVDLHKLQTLVGFDVVQRYEDLLHFYKTKGFKEEEQWVMKRLAFIHQS